MESMLPSQWHRHARTAKGKQYEAVAHHLAKQGDFVAARRAALNAFRSPSVTDNCVSKIRILLFVVACEAAWKLRRGVGKGLDTFGHGDTTFVR